MTIAAAVAIAILTAALTSAWYRRTVLPDVAMGLARVRIDLRGRVLRWRGADVALFGWSADELVGRNVSLLMPGHVAEEHDAYLQRFAAERMAGRSRILGRARLVRAVHRDGHEVPVVLFVRPVPSAVGLQFEGVLQRVPVEGGHATPPADGAQVTPEVSWRWLRNFGHEVRTPMAAVLGHAEILVDPQSDAHERAAAAQAVLANSRHLMMLLNDLLDHARLAAGHHSVRAERVNVRELLHETATMVRAHAEHRGLTLQVLVADDVPAVMHGDPLRIRQILLNLLGNAMKFTRRGFVRLEALARGGGRRAMLRFEVCDSGEGIAAEFLPHLFQPFQQETRTQGGLHGTGLGLAIGRRLARLMGGELSLVDSAPGAGTRFRLEIPVVGAAIGVAPPPAPPGADGRAGDSPPTSPAVPSRAELGTTRPSASADRTSLDGVAVLLVDDAPDLLRVTGSFLRSAGAEVDAFACPREALLACEQRPGAPHHLAVLDLMMPGMSGFELARELRQRQFAGPILALTADQDSVLTESAHVHGFDRFLAKPIRRADLVLACREALRDRVGSDPADAHGGPAEASSVPPGPRVGPLSPAG